MPKKSSRRKKFEKLVEAELATLRAEKDYTEEQKRLFREWYTKHIYKLAQDMFLYI